MRASNALDMDMDIDDFIFENRADLDGPLEIFIAIVNFVFN